MSEEVHGDRHQNGASALRSLSSADTDLDNKCENIFFFCSFIFGTLNFKTLVTYISFIFNFLTTTLLILTIMFYIFRRRLKVPSDCCMLVLCCLLIWNTLVLKYLHCFFTQSKWNWSCIILQYKSAKRDLSATSNSCLCFADFFTSSFDFVNLGKNI